MCMDKEEVSSNRTTACSGLQDCRLYSRKSNSEALVSFPKGRLLLVPTVRFHSFAFSLLDSCFDFVFVFASCCSEAKEQAGEVARLQHMVTVLNSSSSQGELQYSRRAPTPGRECFKLCDFECAQLCSTLFVINQFESLVMRYSRCPTSNILMPLYVLELGECI